MHDENVKVQMVETGEIVDLPYRRAVSYLSRGLAVHAPAPKPEPKPAKKTSRKSKRTSKPEPKEDLSTPVLSEDQEGDDAENKPLLFE